MDAIGKPIRSPSYPSMSLRDAIDAIRKIEGQYRSAPVDRTVAAKVIGYKVLSGPAAKSLADLAAYGLLERAGKGEVRVTERARDILHAQSDSQRRERILEAALDPELFSELRERFKGILIPPADGVATYLNRQGFNPNAVGPAAKAFLDSMSYLVEMGITSNDDLRNLRTERSDTANKTRSGRNAVMPGDLVQWEVNGVLQLPEQRRVRAVSEDGVWVFVEQSETGIPASQVIVEEKAPSANELTPPTLPFAAAASKDLRREVFALEEGDVVLTFPDNLSAESFEDLEAYLKVFIAKMRRRAGTTKP